MFYRSIIFTFFLVFLGLHSWSWAASEYDQGISAYSEKKYDQARNHWEEAAAGGNISAAFNLGILLSKGLGGAKDIERAKIWWERAARQDHSQAQFNLGVMLWNGNGVIKRKASEGGSKQASAFLNQIFEQMSLEIAPSETDPSDANTQVTDSAQITRTVLKALDLAQQAYQDKNYEVAYKYWTYAAKNNHYGAQYQLARLYEAGLGTKTNQSRAFELYKSSAEAGQPQAQFQLAQYYLTGEMVDKNETLALFWIQSAADNSDIRAKDYLEQTR